MLSQMFALCVLSKWGSREKLANVVEARLLERLGLSGEMTTAQAAEKSLAGVIARNKR